MYGETPPLVHNFRGSRFRAEKPAQVGLAFLVVEHKGGDHFDGGDGIVVDVERRLPSHDRVNQKVVTLDRLRPNFGPFICSKFPLSGEKLACIGGSPPFRHADRFPIYVRDNLDSWALSITTPKKSSTSEGRR